MQAPTSFLAELGLAKRRRRFWVTRYTAHARRFETPGPAANLCACAVSESSAEDKMAAGHTGLADWIIYVRRSLYHAGVP